MDGSFCTSSPDVLRFETGPEFATADGTPDPPLSSAAPAAFGFLCEPPAEISLAHTHRLSVNPGETLSVVGGEVDATGSFACPVSIHPRAKRHLLRSAA